MSRIPNLWPCLLLLECLGCAMCANPHDCKYAAYGGYRERADMVHGRVGSVIDPALEVSHATSVEQSPTETSDKLVVPPDGVMEPTPAEPTETLPSPNEDLTAPWQDQESMPDSLPDALPEAGPEAFPDDGGIPTPSDSDLPELPENSGTIELPEFVDPDEIEATPVPDELEELDERDELDDLFGDRATETPFDVTAGQNRYES